MRSRNNANNAKVRELPPPNQVEAERSLLGILMLPHTNLVDEVQRQLPQEALYSDRHRRIYDMICKVHKKGQQVDPLTVWAEYKAKGKTDKRILVYLSECADEVPSAANWKSYARAIKDAWEKRKELYGDKPPPSKSGDAFENFKGLRKIWQVAGADVDQLPILPDRPNQRPFPRTPFDPVIDAIQNRIQAPYVLCAQSVLAAATLCTQHLADVVIPGIGGKGARRPICNFFLTIARSGERKSSVDRLVLEGIEEYALQLERGYKEDLHAYKSALWDYHRREKQIKSDGGAFEELGEEPTPPREPGLLIKEPTQEGLFRALSKGRPSQGLFNDEGGTFLGGYGMSKDHRLRTAATFNALWDGAKLDRPRASESETIRGRRFCVHLMLQPKVSDQLVADSMMADLGFNARCLMAEPESTISQRPFREPHPASLRVCEVWRERCMALLGELGDEDDHGLTPRPLALSPEARQSWIDFYNEVELKLAEEYATIQGFASKAPEHAIRMAAVFTLFEDPEATEISEYMETGIDLVRFYLSEHLRLEFGRPDEMDEDAQLLVDWLRSDRWGEPLVSLRDILRRGPSRIRKRKKALAALEVAVQTGHLKPLEGRHEVRGSMRTQCFRITSEESVAEVSQGLSQPFATP